MTENDRRPVLLGRSIPRRALLGAAPVAAGAVVVAGCTRPGEDAPTPASPGDIGVPHRPPYPPENVPTEPSFFTQEEAATVEAMTARIMPGTEDDPGAVQAGVVVYIDGKLTQFDGHAQPTFTGGPYARAYTGEEPPPQEGVVWVHEDHLYRYGFQSPLTPQEIYREGLARLEEYCQARFGSPFVDLSEDEQDAVLLVFDAVEAREEEEPDENGDGNGEGDGGDDDSQAGGAADDGGGDNGGDSGEEEEVSDGLMDEAEDVFGDLSPGLFFATVRQDTIEGMFSDPAYGGNRDMVGWALIGHPGSQRSYSPAEMLAGTDRQPQPMHLLTPMNPDRAGGGRPAIEQHDQQGG